MDGTPHDTRTLLGDELPRRLVEHPELPERVDAVLQVEIAGEGGGTWAIDLRRAGGPHRLDGDILLALKLRKLFAEPAA